MIRTPEFAASRRLLAVLKGLTTLGGLLFLLGLFLAPARAWTGYLMGFELLVGLGIAGALFIAVLYLSSASWGTPLRRIPEAMTYSIPVAGLLGLVLVFGVHSLYEWSHAAAVASDPILTAKSGWLNTPFFAIRLVVCFIVWTWLARTLVSRSRQQDLDGDPQHGRRNLRTSALFMALLAITYSIATFDTVMSLEPHWFSTIFALYELAGAALSGLAAATILAVMLRRQGALRGVVSDGHLQILGRLLLSLAVLWVYIWYSQYVLIWYSHLPEEVSYYASRKQAAWSVLTPTILVLNWLVPFLVLMPRRACRSETVLLRVSGVVLVGRVLDLYLQIGPPVLGKEPTLGLYELGPVVGAMALFFWLTLSGLADAPVVPEKDPTLAAGIALES